MRGVVTGLFASGAGFVNPPVLLAVERDCIFPAVPICSTDELLIEPILN